MGTDTVWRTAVLPGTSSAVRLRKAPHYMFVNA